MAVFTTSVPIQRAMRFTLAAKKHEDRVLVRDQKPARVMFLATVTKCVQAVIADQGGASAAVGVHTNLIKDCCASPAQRETAKSEEAK
jgi:hypothetical protein